MLDLNRTPVPSLNEEAKKRGQAYSKSPHIRTYFFDSQTEIGSYFKGTKTKFKVWRFLFEECIV